MLLDDFCPAVDSKFSPAGWDLFTGYTKKRSGAMFYI